VTCGHRGHPGTTQQRARYVVWALGPHRPGARRQPGAGEMCDFACFGTLTRRRPAAGKLFYLQLNQPIRMGTIGPGTHRLDALYTVAVVLTDLTDMTDSRLLLRSRAEPRSCYGE
jgi:hypothetical protein